MVGMVTEVMAVEGMAEVEVMVVVAEAADEGC